eukprot:3162648-Rhodomonas_salina.2
MRDAKGGRRRETWVESAEGEIREVEVGKTQLGCVGGGVNVDESYCWFCFLSVGVAQDSSQNGHARR